MLIVTEAACSYVAEVLENAEARDDVAVRLFIDDDDLSMQMDRQRPGDSAYDHKGRVVLVIADDVVAEIGTQTLDIEETDDGPTLAFC